MDAPTIIDVDVASFRSEVVERSRTVPVVLDFWAEWCGPCKELGPALEQLAREGKGRFVLAKVDVDRQPELAQAFQVQAIPTVIGLREGRVVDGFQGALPPAELRAFVDRLAPGPVAGAAERAREKAAAGDREGAIADLRAHLRERTGDSEARILLASLLVDDGKRADARKVLDKLDDEARASDEAKAVETKLAYAETAGDVESLHAEVEARPDDPAPRVELGKALVAAQRHEEGLQELLEAVRLDPSWEGGAARKAMVEVFDMLGPDDPVANDYRYKLSLEIFA